VQRRKVGAGTAQLREVLERLASTYDARFLDTDPLGIVRRYESGEDRELVGLLAAALAYGRVRSIRASIEGVLALVGKHPSRFLESYDPRRDARRFESFVHRFTRGRDVALLLFLVRQARESAGSLGAFFRAGDPDPAAPTYEGAMNAFARRLFALDAGPFARNGRVGEREGVRWLFPVPEDGSVCKRPCLFLRWMIRKEDGLDCGAWTGLPASRLVLPLDTHLERVARALRWTERRSPSWKMALEVTARLRELDPSDPTRFDFALSRLGILGLLPAKGGALRPRQVLAAIDRAASSAATGTAGS
jgi:uncharacterized protein (TIGR02757 family)